MEFIPVENTNNVSSRFKALNIYLILTGILLFGLFLFFLHPISGGFGGFFFFLSGWILPTACNVLISLGIGLWLSKKKITQTIFILLISILFGINTNIMLLFRPSSSTEAEIEINKIFNTKSGFKIIRNVGELYSKIYIAQNPLLSPISVGGNEGCMCMYYEKAARPLSKALDSFHYIREKSENIDSILFITVEENKDSTVNVQILLEQNGELCARYTRRNIPYKNVQSFLVRGEQNNLLNGHFWDISIDILLHNNIWSYILSPLTKKENFDDIKNFYNEAMR